VLREQVELQVTAGLREHQELLVIPEQVEPLELLVTAELQELEPLAIAEHQVQVERLERAGIVGHQGSAAAMAAVLR
jgi:hypothetical protein